MLVTVRLEIKWRENKTREVLGLCQKLTALSSSCTRVNSSEASNRYRDWLKKSDWVSNLRGDSYRETFLIEQTHAKDTILHGGNGDRGQRRRE